MKNKLSKLLFLLTFISFSLFAEEKLPIEVIEKFYQVYGSTCTKNGEWIFINGSHKTSKKNILLSFNTKTKKTFTLFESFLDSNYRFVNGIYFYEKNKKLYFEANGGGLCINGVKDVFIHNGLYSVQKDKEGNYSNKSLTRYSSIPYWHMGFLVDAYIKAPIKPDYDGFLKVLYSYADTGSNPIFGLKIDDETFFYEKDAINYLVKNEKFDSFFMQNRSGDLFPFEKYLFCKDKSQNPTQKSAFTLLEKNPFYTPNSGFVYTETCFAEGLDSLFFTVNKGSTKQDGFYTYDYSVIYELIDDKNGFYTQIPDKLKNIKSLIYYNNSDILLPIENYEDGILIRSYDYNTVYTYTNNEIDILSTKSTIKTPDTKNINDKTRSKLNFISSIYIINGILSIIFAVILVYVLSQTKRWKERIIYRIQEDEKKKISRDIHDSVVQDIRALRIETEMLNVQEESNIKKEELIEKITKCIIKMRNICYGLSPAELFMPDNGNGDINLLSILETLCSQWEERTNIPCTFNYEKITSPLCTEKNKTESIVRIIQEAFRNIEKHSFATECSMLCQSQTVDGKNIFNLFIIDNGRGCDIKEIENSKKFQHQFGLRSMKERTEMINGKITFLSTPGDGMQIKLSVEI